MKITITYFLLLFVTLNYGQITINGIIKSNTNETLEYVNIGIKSKNIGTISDVGRNHMQKYENQNNLLNFFSLKSNIFTGIQNKF